MENKFKSWLFVCVLWLSTLQIIFFSSCNDDLATENYYTFMRISANSNALWSEPEEWIYWPAGGHVRFSLL